MQRSLQVTQYARESLHSDFAREALVTQSAIVSETSTSNVVLRQRHISEDLDTVLKTIPINELVLPLPIDCMARSRDGQNIIIGSPVTEKIALLTLKAADDGEIKFSSVSNDKTIRVLCVAFSHDGQRVIAGCSDNNAIIWSLEELNRPGGAVNFLSLPHGAPVNAVCFSPDGQYVFTAGNDGKVINWDLISRNNKAAMLHDNANIFSLSLPLPKAAGSSINSDDQNCVTGASDGFARVWNLSFWMNDVQCAVTHLLDHGSDFLVHHVKYSPGNDFIATCASKPLISNGKRVLAGHQYRLWIAATGKLFRVCETYDMPVRIAFKPNIPHIAVAFSRGRVVVVERDTGRSLFEVQHNDRVAFVEFDAQGNKLITAGRDKRVLFSHVSPREEITTFLEQKSEHPNDLAQGLQTFLLAKFNDIVKNKRQITLDAASQSIFRSFPATLQERLKPFINEKKEDAAPAGSSSK